MKAQISGKEASQKLSESLKAKIVNLPEKQVLAVYMRNTSTDDNKVTVEFAEKINLSTQPTRALAMFNPTDDRFSSGARRTWETMERAVAEKMFNVSIKDGEAYAEIGQVLSLLAGGKQEFRIQIQEILESNFTDEQNEYKDNYLKRIPSTGAHFFTPGGERVGAVTRLVIVNRVIDETTGQYTHGDAQHRLIEGEYKVDGATAAGAASILESAGVSKKLVS